MNARRNNRTRWLGAALAVAATLMMIAVGPTPADAYSSPAIWVGSPIKGTWNASPSSHHKLVKASPGNDWAVDISGGLQNVVLYVAPSNSAYNARVTTKITQIIDDNTCRAGGGGDTVTVGIYYNGTLYGRATYAHLDRTASLRVGQTVSRWGTVLGAVRTSTANSGGSGCWTGPHVHMEMRAETQYACWNKGYRVGSSVLSPSNFVGFVSGPLSTSARACP